MRIQGFTFGCGSKDLLQMWIQGFSLDADPRIHFVSRFKDLLQMWIQGFHLDVDPRI